MKIRDGILEFRARDPFGEKIGWVLCVRYENHVDLASCGELQQLFVSHDEVLRPRSRSRVGRHLLVGSVVCADDGRPGDRAECSLVPQTFLRWSVISCDDSTADERNLRQTREPS